MRARTWKRTGTVCILLAALAVTSAAAATRVIYCDARATGANDGSSWENAYQYLQDALAAAGMPADTVEIHVAQGIYKPHQMSEATRVWLRNWTDPNGRYCSFLLQSNVVVRGGFAGLGAPNPDQCDPAGNKSILSGDLEGNDIDFQGFLDQQPGRTRGSWDWETVHSYVSHASLAENSYTVVTAFFTGETGVLDGFTVTGGHAEASNVGRTGGGMLCSQANLLVRNCVFSKNTAYAFRTGEAVGGGLACYEGGSPVLRDCLFEDNIAFGYNAVSRGGGVYNHQASPLLINCRFNRNVVAGFGGLCEGGALYNASGHSTLTGCSFSQNTAIQDKGGAVFNVYGGVTLTDCTLRDNSASYGGALYNGEGGSLQAKNCRFLKNAAVNFGRGGAIYNDTLEDLVFSNCFFGGNSAEADGGAMYNAGGPGREGGYLPRYTFTNCVFSGGSARRGGAVFNNPEIEFEFTNCTFTGNNANSGGAIYHDPFTVYHQSSLLLTNCILWLNRPDQVYQVGGTGQERGFFSDIQGGWTGSNNIDVDPQFVDALGADHVAGTEDDNLRLSPTSPCIDAGDSTVISPEMATDLDGQVRLVGRDIDMGAYEFNGPVEYYVAAVDGNDTNSGRSRMEAFATIQKAIDTAADGCRVLVLPGVYHQEIDFKGKAITLSGLNGAPILEAPGAYAVSFFTAEGPTSMLKNFVIRNSEVGVFVSGSSPTIQNVTLVNNQFGIAAYAGGNPAVDSCILWDNADGDLFGCTASFSCIEHEASGEGNISQDPLFADAANGDFHLLSEYGRFVPTYGLWAFDNKTSPCIDAGNPALDASAERTPNGGRIEMGAFGGTPEASLSQCPNIEDVSPVGPARQPPG